MTNFVNKKKSIAPDAT